MGVLETNPLDKKCSRPFCNNKAINKYCSKRCKNIHNVALHAIKTRQKAKEYAGGKCSICGYNTYMCALQFHHLDRNEKQVAFGSSNYGYKWEKLKEEIDKCVLICGNCHAEEEHRLLEIKQSMKDRSLCAYKPCGNIINRSKPAKYCSDKCKHKDSTVRRKNVLKQRFVDYKGGKCEKCGYANYLGALQFHHLNPNEKDFSVGTGKGKALAIVYAELDKCICLCNNCHAEAHEEIRSRTSLD